MAFNLSKWLEAKSDDLAKANIRKNTKAISGEDIGLKYLKIPIIGGFLYLISSFSRAQKVVYENKRQQKEKQDVIVQGREHSKIKRSIQRQINDALLNESFAVLTVPTEYLTEFLEVIKEMDIGVQQLESNKFMLTGKEGVVL